jgi:hypothetical protein
MTVIDIITLVSIILFARLGIRLYAKYKELKKEENKTADKDD